MHVLAICATHGRHDLLERSLRFFLEQDYMGEHTMLIYNNSPISQTLGPLQLPDNKHIRLINQAVDSVTGLGYSSLGAIYNDIIHTHVGEAYDITTHWDDDDIFLQQHLSQGVQGLIRGNKTAYKPLFSFYRSAEGIRPTNNVLEPSIFVKTSWLREYGYSLETTEQHLQWVRPLHKQGELYVDPSGPSTLVYNWGDTDKITYKTSGDFRNPENFTNCRKYSADHGDQIITPWTLDQVQRYYTQANV
jgi:hypothetical protein